MVIAAVRIAFSLLIVICRVLGLSLSALLHSVSHLVLFLFFPILQNHLVLILFFPTLLQLHLICLLLHGTIHLRMIFGSRKIQENLQIRPQFYLHFLLHRLLLYFVHLLQPDISARTSSPPIFVSSPKSLMTISS